MANQYAERDIMALDKDGGHYTRHLSAMTGESLHDKSGIAAELAYRDAHIAELKRERDAYRTAEEHQMALRKKVERERDQAAANANRLRAALHYCNEYLYGSHLNTIGHGSKAHMEIADALGETPVTSLARRDALKQAEALEKILNDLRIDVINTSVARSIFSAIELRIGALRRQAEAQQ